MRDPPGSVCHLDQLPQLSPSLARASLLCLVTQARVSVGETRPHSGPIGPTLWYAPAPLLLYVVQWDTRPGGSPSAEKPGSRPERPSRNERSDVAGRFGWEPVLGGGVPALHQCSGPSSPLPGYQATASHSPYCTFGGHPRVLFRLWIVLGVYFSRSYSEYVTSRVTMMFSVASSDHCSFLPPIKNFIGWEGGYA